ncbi:MAG: alpha/beta hydrolase [Actinobacteria bacterium]|nr:alpha/beta hydrolase [Actinomycetota bacterium]
MKRRRAALWTAGVAAGLAAGGLAARGAVRRQRGRIDRDRLAELATLPPEDVGPVTAPDGTRIAVRAAGDPGAPTLVFAHGFSLDMTTWHHQWTALSDRFRCVLYDHRGHGGSDRSPAGDYSLEAMAGDLRAVLDAAVGEGPCLLVGHSMGGMTLVALAELHPEEFGGRVAGVVLADTSAGELVRGALGAVGARVEALLRPGIRTVLSVRHRAERMKRLFETRGADVAWAITRLTNFGPGADPALVEYVSSLGTQAPVEVWTDALVSLVEMDLGHALEHVRVPALVVVGSVDRLTPHASARAMAEALPDARLIVIEGSGHLPMLERPDELNRILEGFADRVLGAPGAAPGRGRGRRARAGGTGR